IDGVMIGRGIFHNPFAFEKEPREHTSKELLDLLRLHLSLFNKYEKNEIRQFKSLRRFFKIYVRGIRGASELRHQLMNTQSIAEARALLDEFEAQMDEDVKIEL
ncbi:tRNA-dihydrouridine synthase, partial [Staphylococcus aureus]|nr:tRNA-dihydrouridine synthase [Staphylococcus aureus]